MREIKFRGKRVDNGEWVYGLPVYMNYIKEFTKHEWIDNLDNNRVKTYQTSADFQIEEKTLGQYIGLKDKNGTKIFDGDIVKYEDDSGYPSYDVFVNVGVIEYCGNAFWVSNRNRVDMQDLVYDTEGIMECEVIGNIHDNKLEDFYE